MHDAESDEIRAAQLDAFERLRADQARLLHGELGGLLVAARMGLASLGSAPEPSAVAAIDAQLAAALAVKQRVEDSLHPGLLEHFGPGAALAAHFEATCRTAGASLQVDVAAGLPMPAAEDAIRLYRAGEGALALALQNGAASVQLVVTAVSASLVLSVIADGLRSSGGDSTGIDVLARWLHARGGRLVFRRDGLRSVVEAAVPLP